MSPLDLDLGVDLSVVDEPSLGSSPTATDTGFLLHSVAPANPQTPQLVASSGQAAGVYSSAAEPTLMAAIDAYFGIAPKSRLWVASLGTGTAAAAVAAFEGDQYGAGQLIAPEVVTAPDVVSLRDWAWANNKVYVAQAPDGVTDAALTTLADAVVAPEGRFTMLEGDILLIPGGASGATRDVGASVVEAALMARSDINTKNPNLAAAGGEHTPGSGGLASPYVVGIKSERPATSQVTLARAQVNSFRTVNGTVRSYGYWTMADLVSLPQWWDVSGSRTVMAARAREQAIAEELMFGQVAADGAFLDRYKGALAGELAELQRDGALFGSGQAPGYSVNVSADVNPLMNVARGLITAAILLKTSPFAAELKITLTRRAIADEVAA